MSEPPNYGPAYTSGRSYRARAEARQRQYRAEVLQVGWDTHGHWLPTDEAARGLNFLVPAAHEAAVRRASAGKGVAGRTFTNMLSSQAMCFNLFAPLAADLDLATAVLTWALPELRRVRSITIEYTPAADVFGDQSGRGGVDCDVLVEATLDVGDAVVVIETKFVEEEFSTCGFRKAGRAARGQVVCPPEVPVGPDRDACAYQGVKGYGYWARTDQHGSLRALAEVRCPFGGELWQLWVNHTLAHEEARRRSVPHARFAVCAAAANDALLDGGRVLGEFGALVAVPETVSLLPLDELIEHIGLAVGEESGWVRGLRARYGGI